MKKNQIFLSICTLCYAFFFSCDNIKTTKINIVEEGLVLTARVLKDSIVIEENSDTVRIFHGKFIFKDDEGSIEAVFDKGFINGVYREKWQEEIYEGKFLSKGAKLFYQQNGSDLIPNSFRFEEFSRLLGYGFPEYSYGYGLFINGSNYFQNFLQGYIGIPTGRHIFKRNNIILAEMEFDQGVPVGKWKKELGNDEYEIFEFESGNILRNYTLQYRDGEIIKRIEADREFIYENGVEIAIIVKLEFNCSNGGVKLSVPLDKMWTPLFYEVKTNSSYYTKPKIYPTKATSGIGWLRSESYDFPKKDDFQSYKISKQNNKAIYGDGDQAVLVNCSGYATYTAYFLEELK